MTDSLIFDPVKFRNIENNSVISATDVLEANRYLRDNLLEFVHGVTEIKIVEGCLLYILGFYIVAVDMRRSTQADREFVLACRVLYEYLGTNKPGGLLFFYATKTRFLQPFLDPDRLHWKIWTLIQLEPETIEFLNTRHYSQLQLSSFHLAKYIRESRSLHTVLAECKLPLPTLLNELKLPPTSAILYERLKKAIVALLTS